MSDRLDEFPDDMVVVLVTFTDQQYLAGYRSELGISYRFVTDRHRLTYAMFGFGRAPFWKVWGPRGIAAWFRAVRAGRAIRGLFRFGEDTLQLGGDVVVGADGTIVAIHRPTGSHDRPSVDQLIADATSAGRG